MKSAKKENLFIHSIRALNSRISFQRIYVVFEMYLFEDSSQMTSISNRLPSLSLVLLYDETFSSSIGFFVNDLQQYLALVQSQSVDYIS